MGINNQLSKVTNKDRQKILAVLSLYPSLNNKQTPVSIKRNTIAFINKVYIVEFSNKRKFVLRESHQGVDIKHLKLEVEVLNYLQRKKFKLSPIVIKNKFGHEIVNKFGHYYIVQTFMPGQTVANWDNLDNLKTEQLKNFFKASAKFSLAVKNFKSNLNVKSVGLADYVASADKWFLSKLASKKSNQGLDLLKKQAIGISGFIKETKTQFNKIKYQKIPKQLVHFDLHPGNVNYVGNKVSGIFDFDWVRFDSSLSDLAGAIAQSCYYFGGKKSGIYRPNLIRIGLKTYLSVYGDKGFSKVKEQKFLPVALRGCIVFQLMFMYDWYLQNINSKRHFIGLKHFVNLIVKNNFDNLIR